MEKAIEGDIISLAKQDVKVVKCDKCDHLMVNIDADQLALGDLTTLKQAGVRISHPETMKEICLNCEFTSFGDRLDRWFDDDDDDDSSFFGSTGTFGGSLGSGGFSGGFGGFGGGSFGGGGASRGF